MNADDSRRTVYAVRRLTVCLTLIVGGVTFGGPATASFGPLFEVNPLETTLGQFTLLDITVDGDWDNRPISFNLQGVQVASGTTDGGGNFASGDVPVPSGVATCGANEIDWYVGGGFVDYTDITVYCPAVRVSPDPVQAAGGSDSFAVTGSGFPTDRGVTFTLDGSPVSFPYTATDGNGHFDLLAASVPALPCGTHQLTATAQPPPVIQWNESGSASTVQQYEPIPASTTFTVGGCPTPPPTSPTPTPTVPPPPSRGAAKLTANPDVISDGMLTHVTGTGFPAGSPVTLIWASAVGVPQMLCSPDTISAPQLSADSSGDVNAYCMAPPHQLFGAEKIAAVPRVVTPASFAGLTGIAAAAPVVVEGGSMQPSSGDQFVFRR